MPNARLSTFVALSLAYSAILAEAGPLPRHDASESNHTATYNAAANNGSVVNSTVAHGPNVIGNVTNFNGGIVQGPGSFNIGSNGAYSGNSGSKRGESGSDDVYNYGGNAGVNNGAGDTFNYHGQAYTNEFDHDKSVNGGLAQGSGKFDTVSNGGYSGNTDDTQKRDTYNYGGNAGANNGAYDTFNYDGDAYTNEFDHDDTVNSGIAQGSGKFKTGSNGAYSGNTEKGSRDHKRSDSYNYGGNADSANGAGDTFNNGDVYENDFKNVKSVNGGFVQGSGQFETGNNGAYSGNTKSRRFNKRGESGDYTNYGGNAGTANGAGDTINNGDDFVTKFENVTAVNGGFVEGSGHFETGNNGAYSGNTFSHPDSRARRDESGTKYNYGGNAGTANGAYDTLNNGSKYTNSFEDVGSVNGGFVEGSGDFATGNNGAYSGNTFKNQKRESYNYGGDSGSGNGYGDVIHDGSTISNKFDHVKDVNGGFAQGSGNFTVGSNGAYSGNTVEGQKRSDSYNFGGNAGTANGAYDNINNGSRYTNTFENVTAVNGGFVQGSGNFRTGNNGAYGGNAIKERGSEGDDYNFGGNAGSANGAYDTIHNGSTYSNVFKNVSDVNGGFVQGSGKFKTENNGAYSGNTIKERGSEGDDYNFGGNAGSANGAYDTIHNGSTYSNVFKNVSDANGGFVQGSGKFKTDNNGAYGGNKIENKDKRQATYTSNGGENGLGISKEQEDVKGDAVSNDLKDIKNLNGGLTEGSGNYKVGSNGADSGNRVDTGSSAGSRPGPVPDGQYVSK